MIGILLRFAMLQRVIMGTERNENIEYYKKLAVEHQVDVLFYCTGRIGQKKVRGYKYSYKTQSFHRSHVDIPKVNLVRTILSTSQYFLLKKVAAKYSVIFLNLVKGRDKYKVYTYLKKMQDIKDNIPETARLSYRKLLFGLKESKKVVLKPSSGSLGRGIYTIERFNYHYLVSFISNGKQKKTKLPLYKLNDFYKSCFSSGKMYLIQPYLHFKLYEGKKFDVRTSVQKGHNGQWSVTGIVTRVAGGKKFVTNVAQGGKVVAYKKVESTLSPEIKNKIYALSLQIAQHIETLNPSTMDLGLDIGIDEQEQLWFIEANYCDQRYAYKESMNFAMWERSYRYPFEYALYIYKKLNNKAKRFYEVMESQKQKSGGKEIAHECAEVLKEHHENLENDGKNKDENQEIGQEEERFKRSTLINWNELKNEEE
ncbi:YheC/YheD family protein [Bacillus horti]|uniref:Glutathione synthase/RimK-type ligase-like ATP-grasp enzyme n=1 Tax=Caldalkalibacillus horti TaxID=77523 RepID=A0ABT9W4C9_9BACI|nr:YheC/YheD family protein [Bacillus horti]MDQ0168100.1 glutathione synthase/RimK-type ligase-like ATP-grasp enzyme [Bacillus horti]